MAYHAYIAPCRGKKVDENVPGAGGYKVYEDGAGGAGGGFEVGTW